MPWKLGVPTDLSWLRQKYIGQTEEPSLEDLKKTLVFQKREQLIIFTTFV
jgi:hypothetical protein